MKTIVIGLVVVGFGLVLVACGQPAPGVAIDWGKQAPQSHALPGPIATASASERPSANATGADVPARFWSGLNHNTAEVARGEYLIISQLKQALELQITRILPKR